MRDLDSEEVSALLGFHPLDVGGLPSNYTSDGVEVFPEGRMVRQCFSGGSRPHSLPLFCVSQSPSPLKDLVGQDATVFYLEAPGIYIEYAYGGWIGVGSSSDPVRTYQWDNRMVPSLAVRYVSESIYTELSATGDRALALEDLVRFATSQSGAG